MTPSISDRLYRPLPGPDEMRLWDRLAREEYALPAAALMENAAKAALEEIARLRPFTPETRVLIFAGRGNNGGDGAALARMLADEGVNVLVVATGSPETAPYPANEHWRAALALGVPVRVAEKEAAPELPEDWRYPDIVVDALTGSGLHGDLRPKELALVRSINAFRGRALIVALDSPSGLCGHSGRPMPEAVRADLTVAFEEPVRGLLLNEGHNCTGSLVVRRVGIPLALRRQHPPAWRLLAPEKAACFTPSPLRHKGGAGKVLIVGGSLSMSGAPCLAGLGALRAGAGLVHLALPEAVATEVRAGFPELQVHAVNGKGGAWQAAQAKALLALVADIRPDALVIGPGLGRNSGAQAIVKALLQSPERPPCVVDADALFFFSASGNSVKNALPAAKLLRAGDIISPHPGEAARLLPEAFFHALPGAGEMPEGGDNAAPPQKKRAALLQTARPEALAALTAICPATVILKGAYTLTGERGSPVTLSPFAEAALAVGGSGDVLAGVLAALLATGIQSCDAAALGVYLHGRAGQLLAAKAPAGHLAREIADHIPLAWKELCPR